MALDAFDSYTDQPGECMVRVRLLGTGASAPTKQYGRGLTVTRTSAGLYKLTFAENPGTFVIPSSVLGAETPGNVKSCSVTWDTWDATTLSIEVAVWDSGGTARDLAATEYLHATLVFQRHAGGL